MAKESSASGKLRRNVRERGGISFTTKLKVYRATVLNTLLYASESGSMCSQTTEQLPQELPVQTSEDQVAGHSTRLGSLHKGQYFERVYSSPEGSSQMDRSCDTLTAEGVVGF